VEERESWRKRREGEGREAAYLASQGYSCCPGWRHPFPIRRE